MPRHSQNPLPDDRPGNPELSARNVVRKARGDREGVRRALMAQCELLADFVAEARTRAESGEKLSPEWVRNALRSEKYASALPPETLGKMGKRALRAVARTEKIRELSASFGRGTERFLEREFGLPESSLRGPLAARAGTFAVEIEAADAADFGLLGGGDAGRMAGFCKNLPEASYVVTGTKNRERVLRHERRHAENDLISGGSRERGRGPAERVRARFADEAVAWFAAGESDFLQVMAVLHAHESYRYGDAEKLKAVRYWTSRFENLARPVADVPALSEKFRGVLAACEKYWGSREGGGNPGANEKEARRFAEERIREWTGFLAEFKEKYPEGHARAQEAAKAAGGRWADLAEEAWMGAKHHREGADGLYAALEERHKEEILEAVVSAGKAFEARGWNERTLDLLAIVPPKRWSWLSDGKPVEWRDFDRLKDSSPRHAGRPRGEKIGDFLNWNAMRVSGILDALRGL